MMGRLSRPSGGDIGGVGDLVWGMEGFLCYFIPYIALIIAAIRYLSALLLYSIQLPSWNRSSMGEETWPNVSFIAVTLNKVINLFMPEFPPL